MTEQGGPRLSEEFLNAFVDNQIDADEKGRAYPLINEDSELNRRVCELRKVSDLVRLAYDAPPPPPHRQPRDHRWQRYRAPVLAVMMLAIGLALGWSLRMVSRPTGTFSRAGGTVVASASPPLTTKVLFHLDNGDRAHMRQVLEEAHHLLAHYRADHKAAKVEILADGPGLTLLRAHKSPFVTEIARLQKDYPNLIFAACQDTINRLERRQGSDPHLLPEAVIVPSAIAEIVHLQHRGWTYIRV